MFERAEVFRFPRNIAGTKYISRFLRSALHASIPKVVKLVPYWFPESLAVHF